MIGFASAATRNIFFFFNDTATTEIYPLSLHDALPIYHDAAALGGDHAHRRVQLPAAVAPPRAEHVAGERSEEHTSELQSQSNLVCRLLLEKKKATRGQTGRRQNSGKVLVLAAKHAFVY